ncbi:Zn-ribbon domain-containing OB-fold protein [Salsuginibacillus kocurii]|uniref:Zn-ribbon domain-containing OB-fold protein n=1 Tax=Salsuginibacillus kocurii TaxID=427078 RepID=UPI0003801836|nr:OB-fold domain-containing protein [Salsuginibacillus kocurii]
MSESLDGQGIVYSHTTIHAAPANFADEAPYTVVLVEHPSGLRFTGRLKDGMADSGDTVVLSELKEDAYWFKRPAEGTS